MAQGYKSSWVDPMFSALANVMVGPDPTNVLKASLMAAQRESAYADAGFNDARTLRSEQFRTADTDLAALLSDPSYLNTPEGRARLVGAIAKTEQGQQYGGQFLGRGASIINPNLPGLDTIMVGSGAVNDYAQTPGGFRADQTRLRDKTAADNEMELEKARIGAKADVDVAGIKASGDGAGGDGAGAKTPKWDANVQKIVYDRIATLFADQIGRGGGGTGDGALKVDENTLNGAVAAAKQVYEQTGDIASAAMAGARAFDVQVKGTGGDFLFWGDGKPRLEIKPTTPAAAPGATPAAPAQPGGGGGGGGGGVEYRMDKSGNYWRKNPDGTVIQVSKEEALGQTEVAPKPPAAPASAAPASAAPASAAANPAAGAPTAFEISALRRNPTPENRKKFAERYGDKAVSDWLGKINGKYAKPAPKE